MKRLRLLFAILLTASCGEQSPPSLVENILDYLRPAIGTGGHYFGYGSVFAGACMPFGLAKPGPNTSGPEGAAFFHHFSGYHAEDEYLFGIGQVHISGTGAQDYGALLLLPTTVVPAEPWRDDLYRTRFEKSSEVMKAGYYSVRLASGILVELTASEHCAFHRYTFPQESADAKIIFDAGFALGDCQVKSSSLSVEASGRVTGELLYAGALTDRSGGVPIYFVAEFSEPFSSARLWADGQLLPDGATSASGQTSGAVLTLSSARPVLVRIGLSTVDLQGAEKNLEEIAGRDFDTVRAEAEATWEKMLSRAKIAGGSEEERIKFYTALFHALFTPTLFSDSDSRYRGFDGQIHQAQGWRYYSDFSLWDTYRTTHQLFSLLYPEYQRDFVLSLLDMAERDGHLPRWPAGLGDSGSMVGAPAEIVLAESVLQEVSGIDPERIWQVVLDDASAAPPEGGREGFSDWVELGYLPADKYSGSAAKSLEFALADAAVAKLAEKLGRNTEAETFRTRSLAYRKLFHPDVGFIRGRNSDGSWHEPFDPLNWSAEEYVEGTAWQYLWLVPQDPQGLAEILGGKEAAARKLEEFFTTPEPENPLAPYLPKVYYWQGNEPDLHAAYLFNHFGQPEKTQYFVRKILRELYGTGADGLAGNDDCGTLSAWYVLSAAGLYPLAGTGSWELTAPLFSRVVFSRPGGQLEIRALPAEGDKVRAVRIDGKSWNSWQIDDQTLGRVRLVEFLSQR